MVSKQTVLNALAWLALYGFLDKLRRIVRIAGLLGPRVRQTSNAYVMCFPKGLGGLAANVFGVAPEYNNWTPSDSNSAVKKGFQGSGCSISRRRRCKNRRFRAHHGSCARIGVIERAAQQDGNSRVAAGVGGRGDFGRTVRRDNRSRQSGDHPPPVVRIASAGCLTTIMASRKLLFRGLP